MAPFSDLWFNLYLLSQTHYRKQQNTRLHITISPSHGGPISDWIGEEITKCCVTVSSQSTK